MSMSAGTEFQTVTPASAAIVSQRCGSGAVVAGGTTIAAPAASAPNMS